MDTTLRLSVFVLVFLCVAGAEFFWPRRKKTLTRAARWPHNIGLTFLNVLLVRILLPVSLAGFALIVQEHGWGIFSYVSLPYALKIILSIVLLDMVIYGQHVMFHKVPVLWRLHRVHHTDTEMDVTTALRFHPIEIMLSMGLKFVAVLLLGVPPEATLLFEIILNACAMFNHGNIKLPSTLDRWLRFIIVTPDMHRVHHSIDPQETNSNYGFNISLWDCLFGTYRAQPKLGHNAMIIGIDTFRSPLEVKLNKLLTQPFREIK